MNKLTTEKCREFISVFKSLEKEGHLALTSAYHLQALEIALPILEQQERGEGDITSVRDEKVSFELLPDESEYDRLNRMYQWMKVKPAHGMSLAGRGEHGWIEWGGGKCPVDDNANVEIKFRDGCLGGGIRKAGGYYWGRSKAAYDSDIIAYRIIPEQPTNQRGGEA